MLMREATMAMKEGYDIGTEAEIEDRLVGVELQKAQGAQRSHYRTRDI